MWSNYFKTALRNLRKDASYSFLNIAGLTLGLACCILIFQYVAFHYSFDDFHEHEDSLYRVITAIPQKGDSFEPGGAFTPQALAPALRADVPEIRRVTRVHPEYSAAIVSIPDQAGQVFKEEDISYADSTFLKMFSFPLASGSTEGALRPGTALLTRSFADKVFGPQNPIGKTIRVAGRVEKSYRVTGILRDVPANSHLQFKMLLPMVDLLQVDQYADEPMGGWSWNNFLTYVQLYPDADISAANRKMTSAYKSRNSDWLQEQGRKVRVWTQPLQDVHLNAAIVAPAGKIGSYRTVYFFIVIGLVTLAIALLNYVNLATARSLDRSSEIGVRKAVGAHRNQIMGQFLFESAFVNVVAVICAIGVAVALTLFINDLAGTQMTWTVWLDPVFWLIFVGTFGTSTLLAGLYPAFVLSSFDPVSVLKGRGTSPGGGTGLRKGLVILQFGISFMLLAGTAVVHNQIEYVQSMDTGLNLENVLTLPSPPVLPDETNREAVLKTFVQELRQLPNVEQVAQSRSLPGRGFNWHGAALRKPIDDPANSILGVATYVDTSFTSLYGMDVIAGQGFTNATVSPDQEQLTSVLANRTAVQNLGFESPSDAVGRSIVIGESENAQIIGVVEDVHWSSAHEEQKNVIFGYTRAGEYISLRMATDDLPGTTSKIERMYTTMFPGNPFSYSFISQTISHQYRGDRQFASLFAGFAGLAILIACLGLFGLASFTAKKRKQEIGVRKVVGASVSSIVTLLSGQFLKLVLTGVIVATPLAYLGAQRWLQGFAYRMELTPWVFLGAGVAALVIAVLTVSYQSIKAALVNPAQSVRNV